MTTPPHPAPQKAPDTGSRRAQALLELALSYGHDVSASEHTPFCWIVRAPGGGPGDPSLTVYALGNNAAEVMYDRTAGSSTWDPITQSYARLLITERALGPEHLWVAQTITRHDRP